MKTGVVSLSRLTHEFAAGALPEALRDASRGGLSPRHRKIIVKLVEEKLGENLSIGRLASVTGLSYSYFSRAFSASFGVTPSRYVRMRRVAMAKELIKSSCETLSSVALRCGFHNEAALAKAFRTAKERRTPRQFQEYHAADVAGRLAAAGVDGGRSPAKAPAVLGPTGDDMKGRTGLMESSETGRLVGSSSWIGSET